jgi:hypothetical protein
MGADRHLANMANDPRIGRTLWDVLNAMLTSRSAFVTLLAVACVVIPGLWYLVHTQAEPGTEVSLAGVLRYQKAKPVQGLREVSGPSPTLESELVSNLRLRLVTLEKERAQERLAAGSQVEKLNGDLRDRDRQLQELRNASPEPFAPSLHTYLFKWQLSDDKCKVRAAEAIREAGGEHVAMDKLATMGRKNLNNITVLCNSPHYAVIVAGPDGDITRDVRDAVHAVMVK